ncbi:YHYH domain-containing protein [Marinomonas sp. NPDC078689]
MKALLLSISLIVFSTSVISHSGGTDSRGCHTNHKTSEYHCHKRK